MKNRILKLLKLFFAITFILSGCGGSDNDDPPPNTLDPVTISGKAQAPSGSIAHLEVNKPIMLAVLDFMVPPSWAAVTGLTPVANAVVELVRIDDDGNQVGAVLASTTTDASGNYTLELPDGVSAAPDLVVQIKDSANQPVLRAMVTGDTVDIDPVSQFILNTLINEPGLVLASVNLETVQTLVEQVAAINIDFSGGTVTTLEDAQNAVENDSNITQAVETVVDTAVSSLIVGAWGNFDSNAPGMLVFYAHGTYLNYRADAQDCPGGGVEYGTYSFDGSNLTISNVTDENGQCGLKGTGAPAEVTYTAAIVNNGSQLDITSGNPEDGTASFPRVATGDSNSIVGGWAPFSSLEPDGGLVFYANGHYIVHQAVDSDPNCAAGGVEYGTYSHDGTTLSGNTLFDGNQSCGLNSGTGSFSSSPVTIANHVFTGPEGDGDQFPRVETADSFVASDPTDYTFAEVANSTLYGAFPSDVPACGSGYVVESVVYTNTTYTLTFCDNSTEQGTFEVINGDIKWNLPGGGTEFIRRIALDNGSGGWVDCIRDTQAELANCSLSAADNVDTFTSETTAQTFADTANNTSTRNLEVSFAFVQNREFESGAQDHRGLIGLLENGSFLPVSEIASATLTGPNGEVVPNAGDPQPNVFSNNIIRLGSWDPTTEQFGSIGDVFEETGVIVRQSVAIFDAGTYTLDVTLTDGTQFSHDVSFPGTASAPLVPASSIAGSFLLDGSFAISWTEPASAFDQYRVFVTVDDRDLTLRAHLGSGVESIVIPANVMATLLTGSTDTDVEVRVQTRLQNTAGNHARNHSNVVSVAIPQDNADFGSIVGAWGNFDSNAPGMMVFYAHGTYLNYSTDAQDCPGGGVEYGNYSFDGSSLTISNVTDENGQCGLKGSGAPAEVTYTAAIVNDGNQLDLTSGVPEDGTASFPRVATGDPDSIVGGWAPFTSQQPDGGLVFYANGHYIVHQPAGSDPNCAAGGVEYGTYSHDGSTLSGNTLFDDNQSCGVNSGTGSFTSSPVTIANHVLTGSEGGGDRFPRVEAAGSASDPQSTAFAFAEVANSTFYVSFPGDNLACGSGYVVESIVYTDTTYTLNYCDGTTEVGTFEIVAGDIKWNVPGGGTDFTRRTSLDNGEGGWSVCTTETQAELDNCAQSAFDNYDMFTSQSAAQAFAQNASSIPPAVLAGSYALYDMSQSSSPQMCIEFNNVSPVQITQLQSPGNFVSSMLDYTYNPATGELAFDGDILQWNAVDSYFEEPVATTVIRLNGNCLNELVFVPQL